jgi:DNA-binding MarR family transcriptional regulator
MAPSTPRLPTDRQAVGQLVFRAELFGAPGRREQFPDIRLPHLQIWGNVGIDGVRLTALAERANLSLAACSELVNELQDAGYLERRPDPSDGRAKLIYPTAKGRRLLDEAGRVVAEVENHWRNLCPPGEFDRACHTLDQLLNSLGPRP